MPCRRQRTISHLSFLISSSIESVVRITGITSYMLIRSPTLGACALSIVPLVAIVNRTYGIWLSKNAREVQDALAKANSVAQETFSCIRTVIAFSSERFEYTKYVERINHQYQLNVRQVCLRSAQEEISLLQSKKGVFPSGSLMCAISLLSLSCT